VRPPDAQRLFDLSPDLLGILDAEGRILAANPAWNAYVPLEVDDLYGWPFLELLRDEDIEDARAAFAAGSGEQPTNRWQRRDGEEAWVRWSIERVHGSSHTYVVGRDVTPLVQRAESLAHGAHEPDESDLGLRLARELHDGVLQMLTGASLQVEAIIRMPEADRDTALLRLKGVASALNQEQKDLRLLVEELRSEATIPYDSVPTAEQRLRAVLERIRGVWDMEFTLDVHGVNPPPQVARTLARLVQEAAVNAIRHGPASQVSVELGPREGGLMLRVSDNGFGFPFKGVLDHDELRAQRLGPLSLKHRVEDAGWSLSIDSSATGSTITVFVPSNGESGP